MERSTGRALAAPDPGRGPPPHRHGGNRPRDVPNEPVRQARRRPEGRDRLRSDGIDALVAIGGDDTLSAARELARRGGKVVGVPKTMDNDVGGTDWTFGFHSAVAVAVDAVERLRDTAASHHRAVVLEVMGRHAGWVALATGLASGADATLVPEEPYDEARLMDRVRDAARARGFAVVVASEGIDLGPRRGSAGAKDEFGHELLREREVGAELARRIQEATGIETRSAQIGHIQRGGAPELFDRLLATRLGAEAVDLALAGKFGQVAVLRGSVVLGIPLDEAVGTTKVVTRDWLDLLHTFDAVGAVVPVRALWYIPRSALRPRPARAPRCYPSAAAPHARGDRRGDPDHDRPRGAVDRGRRGVRDGPGRTREGRDAPARAAKVLGATRPDGERPVRRDRGRSARPGPRGETSRRPPTPTARPVVEECHRIGVAGAPLFATTPSRPDPLQRRAPSRRSSGGPRSPRSASPGNEARGCSSGSTRRGPSCRGPA